MKKVSAILSLVCLVVPILLPFSSTAQSDATSLRIYNLFQTKCVSCHQAGDAAGGLDLSGAPADVYTSLVGATPSNLMAASKGDELVMPGHPYRSFLLRKIHNGICDTDCHLEDGEQDMIADSHNSLTNIEAELVRQWILDGASPTKKINEAIIEDYYNEGGLERLERPTAPDPSEGFQVHLGPIFLAPSDEKEYFIKYNLNLPDDIEVNRIESIMNDFSHHFIMYKFRSENSANNQAEGLRPLTNVFDAFGGNTDMVCSWQYSEDIRLPAGTAYSWEENTTLDLNYHIPNYSSSSILASDVYLNVYTQPKGTAIREMQADLLLYNGGDFFCLPSSNETQFLTDFSNNFNDWNIWLLSSHTHQLGTDFDIYINNGGQKGEQIFEGEIDNYYDWSHPPINYYEPFVFLPRGQGLIQEAAYENNTGRTVCFGVTTEDEMMLSLVQYIEGGPFPFVAINGVADSYCIDDGEVVSLQPTPAGGILGGPGVVGNQLLTSSLSEGKHILTYSYPFEGETIVAKKEVRIYANPTLPNIQQTDDLLQVEAVDSYTYQWFLDGAVITGATNAEHTAVANGSYTVVVTNENACSTNSLPLQVIVNSIYAQTLSPIAFEIYPNPIYNEFYLNYTLTQPMAVQLSLYTIDGRMIQSIVEEQQQAGKYQYVLADVATTLPSGLYTIQGFIGEKWVNTKLIKH